MLPRDTWTTLTDSQLLQQCAVDTYRASGPGGQKRNKTSSAVRLRHLPSGLIVIAEESRSQHENKEKALKRLRREFYLQLRMPVPADQIPEALLAIRTPEGRYEVSRKDSRFWPACGVLLDYLDAYAGRISDVAEKLGSSTAQLVDLIQQEPRVWQTANQIRAKYQQKPLR